MIMRSSAIVRTRARRLVHLARPGGPACGGPRSGLVAMNAHGDDRLDWVTCPACKLDLARGCDVMAVTGI